MKFKNIFLCFAFSIASLTFSKKIMAQEVAVNFQVFYDELSPYGTWVNNPEYGYVWRPNVEAGFQPYSTNGYWVYTENGWTWVSNYSWGWAPFHYGRWYYDDMYGAMWIPDNEWGPGWVTWRQSEGYYGWAAMSPGMTYGMTYGGDYHEHHHHWTFVHSHDFGRTDITHYYTSRAENVTIINNTTVINNPRLDDAHHVNYNGGPNHEEVEKRSGQKFQVAEIKANDKPSEKFENNQLHLYRPAIQKNISTDRKPMPAKVSSRTELTPISVKAIATSPQKSNQVEPIHAKPAANQPQNFPRQHTAPNIQPRQQSSPTPQQNNNAEKQPPHNSQPAMQPHQQAQPPRSAPTQQQQPRQQAPHQSSAPIQQNRPPQNMGGEEHRPH